MIICLCGSTRFKPIFMEAAEKLTLAGNIIVMPHVFHHDAESQPISEEQKAMLDDLHKRKIDLADKVVVITDETRYVGKSTLSEMGYAGLHGKTVTYWEEIKNEY